MTVFLLGAHGIGSVQGLGRVYSMWLFVEPMHQDGLRQQLCVFLFFLGLAVLPSL
jgi:hypothetical protein